MGVNPRPQLAACQNPGLRLHNSESAMWGGGKCGPLLNMVLFEDFTYQVPHLEKTSPSAANGPPEWQLTAWQFPGRQFQRRQSSGWYCRGLSVPPPQEYFLKISGTWYTPPRKNVSKCGKRPTRMAKRGRLGPPRGQPGVGGTLVPETFPKQGQKQGYPLFDRF